MGGGGKGGGGGTQIPDFVKEAQKMIGERSEMLHGITSPVMGEGVKQLQSLMTTGGPGAQVPIIANAEMGLNRAMGAAQQEIGAAMERGGGSDPSFDRINQQLGIDQQAARRAIAPGVAGPLISAGMGAALGGSGLAQSGYQSAASALASGVRRPQKSGGGFDAIGLGTNLAKLYGGGAFGSKGGASSMPTGPSQNIWSGGSDQLTFGGGF